MTTHPITSLLQRSLDSDSSGTIASWGLLLLRGGAGALIFYIHGWHKLEGGIVFVRNGTPWNLAEEVAKMHFPAPVASAFAATAVQFVCAPLLAVGLGTRLNAAILTGVLGVAIAQNLSTDRDPQMAILYTLTVAAFVLVGGGRFSVDAWLSHGASQSS